MDDGIRWRRWGIVGGAWLIGALGGPTEPVRACGFAMTEASQPMALRHIESAQESLDDGQVRQALHQLSNFLATVPTDGESASARAVRWRGVRMLGRAMALRWGDPTHGASSSRRAEQLAAISIQLSRLLSEAGGDDPQIALELGLVLVGSGRRAEGVSLLEGLAARDLITSAHGWAALAREREQPAAREAATARCRLMTLHPQRDCGTASDDDAEPKSAAPAEMAGPSRPGETSS